MNSKRDGTPVVGGRPQKESVSSANRSVYGALAHVGSSNTAGEYVWPGWVNTQQSV